MAENSEISWTTHTFNPWEGCQKVGPGCDICYAEARNLRFTGGANWGPGAPRRRTSPQNWRLPLKWNRAAAGATERPRVFCASLADVFDNAVDPAWREDLWRLIAMTPHLDWMLLTKRPGNIAAMLPPSWGAGWHNVWLGCTVVNQAEADRDIPKLLAVPAAVRFLSMEPLLGPVDLHHDIGGTLWIGGQRGCGGQHQHSGRAGEVIHGVLHHSDPTRLHHHHDNRCRQGIDLVIVGGESGHHARPMHPDWARSLRDQCVAAGVALHFKQWGEWAPVQKLLPRQAGDVTIWPDGTFGAGNANDKGGAGWAMRRVGKKAAGRLLDGRTWDQMPGVADG